MKIFSLLLCMTLNLATHAFAQTPDSTPTFTAEIHTEAGNVLKWVCALPSLHACETIRLVSINGKYSTEISNVMISTDVQKNFDQALDQLDQYSASAHLNISVSSDPFHQKSRPNSWQRLKMKIADQNARKVIRENLSKLLATDGTITTLDSDDYNTLYIFIENTMGLVTVGNDDR